MPITIYAIVSRIPRTELGKIEYVAQETQREFQLTPDPVVEWTTERIKAKVMPLDEAEAMARALGWPAHAIVCSRTCAPAPIRRGPATAPDAAFETLERRGLA